MGKKYLIYDVKNIEPIKITSSIKQSDSEFTKSYISGSVMRGAFISNYILLNKINDINTGEHKELLLKDSIRFLNAYPLGENRTFPTPKCFFALKDDLKSIHKKQHIKIKTNISELTADYERIKSFEFVDGKFNKSKLTLVKVDKTENLHIKKKNKSEDNKIFRYESICSGQKFRGIIECNDEKIVEVVKETLNKGMFYLGGSKGSGYGLCKINNIIETDIHPEFIEIDDFFYDEDNVFESSKRIFVYALSDIIYRNSFGEYKTYIEDEDIAKKLDLKNVRLINSYVETDIFTGFNNKWGYRLPLINGIKAGSVLEYEIEGDISRSKVKKFIEDGIGERKNEGFGRVLVLEDINFNRISLKNSNNEEYDLESLDAEQQIQMQLITNRIYAKKLELAIANKVIEISKKLENKEGVTDNQWGKLFRLATILESSSVEDGINKVENYFAHISNKQQNRELANVLDRVQIDNKRLKKYIIDYLKNNEDRYFSSSYVPYITIGNITSEISKEKMFKYKSRILKEVFRLQLKKDSKVENGGDNFGN